MLTHCTQNSAYYNINPYAISCPIDFRYKCISVNNLFAFYTNTEITDAVDRA